MKQEYIATIYTGKGYYYVGPDADSTGIKELVMADRKADTTFEVAYLYKFNPETAMPEGDPLWAV